MLMALLINNPKLHVLTCESALHYDSPEGVAADNWESFRLPSIA